MKNRMQTKIVGPVLNAIITGELDNTTSYRYKEVLADLIADNGMINCLVFNFKDLSFIDSSGLGLIFGRVNQLQGRQGRVIIAAASDYVKRLFTMSGGNSLVTFCDDELALTEVLAR